MPISTPIMRMLTVGTMLQSLETLPHNHHDAIAAKDILLRPTARRQSGVFLLLTDASSTQTAAVPGITLG
jgi:hypothetical protein